MSWKNAQYEGVKSVTPDDNTDLGRTPTDGVRVNVSGNVRMTFASGSEATLFMEQGVDYPYSVTRIQDTDTTAGEIHALYF